MRTKELFKFIKERHAIYERRQRGRAKPWTRDPILQQYRFCNVYRELDTVTEWISTNWRRPYDKDPNLWFAMAVARYINRAETLNEIGTAVFTGGPHAQITWVPKNFFHWIADRHGRGEKIFTGAYIVSTNGMKMDKAQYVATQVLTPLWKARACPPSPEGGRLWLLYNWLCQQNGVGSFMAGQIVADVKFQTMWRKAPDWWTFACPGPGSMRGLNRVMDYPPDSSWGPRVRPTWIEALNHLQKQIDPLVAKAGMPRISAQDLQNCLCEFDKYERVRLGEGRPRALYPGV